jgi:glycosyltransferase Alg8
VKTYILFRLDKQSWTRQKTAAVSNVGAFDGAVLRATSTAMHAFSISIFVLVVAFYVGAMRGSDFFSPYVFSAP